MCSQADDPTTYDAPTPVRPRTYVLSGDRPTIREAALARATDERVASVAVLTLADMISGAEAANAAAAVKGR